MWPHNYIIVDVVSQDVEQRKYLNSFKYREKSGSAITI
jgi:hypothetical protein